MAQFSGKERLLDGIIQKAKAYEANDQRREAETGQFHKQRKRGTTGATDEKHQKSQHSVSQHHVPTRSVKTKPSNRDVNQSRATVDNTIDPSAAKNNQTASARQPESENTMQMTLMSRISGFNRTMPANAFAAATAAIKQDKGGLGNT